jgi:hypothetical protein
MTRKDKIAAFCKERDALLLEADVDKVIEFIFKHSGSRPTSREAGEAAMHKAITAVPSLPIEHRRKSHRWLIEHNCTTLDDGDLG